MNSYTDISTNFMNILNTQSVEMQKMKNTQSLTLPYNNSIFEWIIIFLLFYFVCYLIVSVLFSLETLTFTFNTIDFITIILSLFYVLYGVSTSMTPFVKYLWYNVQPFLKFPIYLLYVFVFIVIFECIMYLFKNSFELFKPVLLSIVQGLAYSFFLVIAIINILEYVFKVPIHQMLERELQAKYNADDGDDDATPASRNKGSCININTIKDPKQLRTMYNSQMQNYQMLRNYYTSVSNPLNLDTIIDNPENNKDKIMNKIYQYWLDNSNNLI